MKVKVRSRAARWAGLPIALALVMALLTGAVTLGIALGATPSFAALPRSAGLDYGRGFFERFGPLSAAFIQRVLGEVISLPIHEARRAGAAAPQGQSERNRFVDVHPLTNDALRDARAIPVIPFTARTNTTDSSREVADPSDCSSVGGTVWYRYIPDRDQRLLAYTFGTDHPVALGAFTGGPGDLKLVECDSDATGNAMVAFPAKSGTTYYFQISAPVRGGNLSFSLDPQGTITMASVSPSGKAANASAHGGSMSPDGRYVAFFSLGTNLAPGLDATPCRRRDPFSPVLAAESTPCFQAYIRDRATTTTHLVSSSASGEPANSHAIHPYPSADGRFVTFESSATNLVTGDTSGTYDLFVKDRMTGRIERIASCPASDACADMSSGVTYYKSSISDDGRYVAFQSTAPLVLTDTNRNVDIFVYDRVTAITERVSVSSSEEQSEITLPIGEGDRFGDWTIDFTPVISPDGRYVKFRSPASNLVKPDNNRQWDTFVRDRLAGTTERVSVSSEEKEANGSSTVQPPTLSSFSADGRYVVFASLASNLVPEDTNNSVDVFVRDRVLGVTTRVSISSTGAQQSQLDQFVQWSAISGNGRFVVFDSGSPLAPGDDDSACARAGPENLFCSYDVFVHDLLTKTTTVVTLTPNGGDSWGFAGGISHDGSVVALTSSDPNLGETGFVNNVFIYQAPPIR